MALTLSCNSPADPLVGQPYSHSLLASGGSAPYTYAITVGALPPGLALGSSTGAITGTPRNTGPYSFTARVTDSLAATASVACSFTVQIPSAALPSFSLQKLTVAMKKDARLPVRGAL